MSGVDPVSSHTVVTPPVGTYDEDSGHVAVRVLDRDGFGAAGVQVTLSPAPPPPTPASQFTTADGCAFFAFLPAGAYTATASATGYVSDEFELAPSQAASVVSGGTTSVVFLYDQASSLNVTLVGMSGGTPPSGVGLSIGNSHILPTGVLQVAGSGSPRSIPNLFPFADGYEVWAGTCADAPAGESPASVEPGAATDVTVVMPDVLVEVGRDDGSGTGKIDPVPDVPVVATNTGDPGCGETFSVGTTDAEGQLLFALPYGTWELNVNGMVTTVVLTPGELPADIDGGWPYDVQVVIP
jgi:hypothetical protein